MTTTLMANIIFIIGLLFFCMALCMASLLPVSYWYADGAAFGILLAILATFVCGLLCMPAYWKKKAGFSQQKAFATVGLCWIMTSLVGTFPFIFTGELSFTDAFFESVSGFTTTGASILPDVEIIPKSLLLWRSLTHWLGGMGIVLLSLALFSLLGVGGIQLYKAEVSGHMPDRLTPRLRDTATLLWKIYVVMTIALILLLYMGGMGLFDAINHSFATIATGGFSTRNASLAAFPSPFIQWTIIFFMCIAGINFTLHLRFLRGHRLCFFKNAECRTYFWILGLSIFAISLTLWAKQVFSVQSLSEFESLLRAVTFQVVSICTTTGFATENYALWPPFTLGILLILTLIGGCVGSTAGGLKMLRVHILTRLTMLENFRFLHPRLVRPFKLDGKSLPATAIMSIVAYFLLLMCLLILCTLILLFCNLDLETAFTASLTSLSNVGPGLGTVGPVNNFAHIPSIAKWVLSIAMLFGRLEIYAILILFTPDFWKQRSW